MQSLTKSTIHFDCGVAKYRESAVPSSRGTPVAYSTLIPPTSFMTLRPAPRVAFRNGMPHVTGSDVIKI